MSENVTIKLKAPLPGHGEMIREVILRPPTFDEYLRIGECWEVGESQTGVRFTIENTDNVREYIEACLVYPKDPLLLTPGGAVLARKLKHAVFDFFRDGDGADAASKTSPTS